MKCKECKEKLKNIPQGFDAFSFLNPIEMKYCENNGCKEFGYVTVVGITEETSNLKE
jgi:hypothetical protein